VTGAQSTGQTGDPAAHGAGFEGPVTTSLILSTRNRPAFALAAVRAVLDGHQVPTEIVVIDQSDGPCPAFATWQADPRCSLRYLWKPNRGVSLGRNTGIAASTGEILLFIDDDILVPPEWIGRIVTCLRRAGEKAVVTGRTVEGQPEVPGAFAPSVDLNNRPMVYRGRPGLDILLTGNMAIYRSAILKVGGFDERLGPGTRFPSSEDNDFGYRLLEAGFDIVFDPQVLVVHRAWRRPTALLPLRWAYGRGQGAYYVKYSSRRDPYMLQRMSRDVGRHLKRALRRLRTDPKAAGADVVYSLAVLTGAAHWLVRRSRIMQTEGNR
jgi:glycosyltransferase involved in cell wall biosynthesis